jgi:hypothetical protein
MALVPMPCDHDRKKTADENRDEFYNRVSAAA